MADEEKKQDETKEEKKEKVGFFKKLGNKFNDATYDMRLQSDFDKKHKKYTIFTGTAVLSVTPEISVEEHLDEKYLLTLDDDEQIAAGNLIRNDETDEVFHIDAVESAKLTVEFEGKSNEKNALKVVLGAPAEKVDVIRVGSEYYLK